MASSVLSVRVMGKCHSPLNQPQDGCKESGASELRWIFRGTYRDQGRCVVVLEVDEPRNVKGSRVNPKKTGGIFAHGSNGKFCELVLESADQENWSAVAATPNDVATQREVLFQSGTG